MAKVLGVGGVFFKCRDAEALRAWYAEHLGLRFADHGSVDFDLRQAPPGALCVWSPFAGDTEYFAPSKKDFMFNLMVDDVEAMLARAEAGGATLHGGIERYEYGSFGWFVDPEGNKVELWQPPGT